jgi:hypothetical protein
MYLRKSAPSTLSCLTGVAALTLTFGCAGGADTPSHSLEPDVSASATSEVPGLGTGSTSPTVGTGSGTTSGAMQSGVGPAGTSDATGGTGTSPDTTTPVTCQGEVVRDNKRIVRLSFNQISRTLHALIDDDFGSTIDVEYQIGPNAAIARTFPPLSSPQEGSAITTGMWQKLDLIASEAGEYTREHLAEVTGCGAEPTDECAQSYVQSFAEQAYRRPLTTTESASILQVYDEVLGIYGTTPEAIQYSVYALLMAPQALYRTEVGATKDQTGPLTQHELASALSYFLTDGPPDSALLTAARDNRLGTPEEIEGQVDRILATPEARKNLEGALFSYFQLDNLAKVKIDNPAFTHGTEENPYTGVRESAYRELELFLTNTLWSEPLTSLLTSRTSYINQTLAPLYGVEVTADGVDDFVATELPPNRGGLITQVGFLAANSRPDVPSVVARGLAINKALLCQTNPPFPEAQELTDLIEEAGLKLNSASERERADYRTQTSPCSSCHLVFDAYGLALDAYDIIGRYRTEDPEGRPIDPSVTLPALFDNVVAEDAVDMQNKIAASPGFAACFSKNMLNWALAEGSQLTPTSCATEQVVKGFSATDKSLSALLKEVAKSQTFTHRKAEGTP